MDPTVSRPTSSLHDAALNNTYRSQRSNNPLSPVSPLDSNGETWKYPPSANTHFQGPGTLHEIPLEKSPAKNRLSRPFEQPYPLDTSGWGQNPPPHTNVLMQANLERADSHLRQQPAKKPKRKSPPPPITIPKAAHPSRPQAEPIPYQADQAPAERSDRRQKNENRVQGSVRHQGWNPLEQLPRKQSSAHKHGKGHRRNQRRSRDLEMQDVFTDLPKGSERRSADYYGGRRCFFFLVVMIIAVIIVIVVAVKKALQ